MIKFTLILLSILSLLLSCSAGPKKVSVASNAAFPPMEYIDDNQALVGFDIDLMKAVAKAAGFEVSFQSVGWGEIFGGLQNGDYDAIVSSVTITDVRKTTYDFSNPYINAGQITVVPLESTAKQLVDLKGRPVGVLKGTTGSDIVEKTLSSPENLKAYDEISLAFEDLFNRRLAGVVIDTPVAAQYVLRNQRYKAAFQMIGDPLTDESYGVVVKKGNKALLALINEGLDRIKVDGTYDKIKAQWLR
ncbi:MAG: basic amino acid ABC transporter substrate-binding protein [Spirochaetales bacterium]